MTALRLSLGPLFSEGRLQNQKHFKDATPCCGRHLKVSNQVAISFRLGRCGQEHRPRCTTSVRRLTKQALHAPFSFVSPIQNDTGRTRQEAPEPILPVPSLDAIPCLSPLHLEDLARGDVGGRCALSAEGRSWLALHNGFVYTLDALHVDNDVNIYNYIYTLHPVFTFRGIILPRLRTVAISPACVFWPHPHQKQTPSWGSGRSSPNLLGTLLP